MRILLSFIMTFWAMGIVVAQETSDGEGDVLVYGVYDYSAGMTSLYVYDPAAQEHQHVGEVEGYHRFSSLRGLIATAPPWFESGEILTDDANNPQAVEFNLSEQIGMEGYPLGWSGDLRYLALAGNNDAGDHEIYIWNRETETLTNITPVDLPYPVRSYNAIWSADGRLAFISWFESGTDEREASEIYIWDGTTSMNLSQNPTSGQDRGMVWNADGRIAFLSGRDLEYDIFVWDGVSLKDGTPDATTYINVAPEFTDYYSFPVWSPEDNLAFVGLDPDYDYVQILLWDGQSVANISQNPGLHNGSPQWNANGDWTFATFFSSKQLVYVRDAENNTLLETEGRYPVWSADGKLIFCRDRVHSSLGAGLSRLLPQPIKRIR